VEAARFQPSALSVQLSKETKQNFFAFCKEVTDKESIRSVQILDYNTSVAGHSFRGIGA
jgi:hypothetical protein